MKILSFDIEEWFHILEATDAETHTQWDNLEVRIHKNVDRILDILERENKKATFFIIGWVAKKYPEIIAKIAEKYEIANHTMNHQLVYAQGAKTFRNELEYSTKILEDIAGKKVKIFRAPGFSIREKDTWAFEVLNELGFEIDCSVFPAAHAHGGMPSYKKVGPSLISCNGMTIKELPISFKSLFKKQIVFSGGGYFRFFPYFLINKWAKKSDYLMTYFHPRDFDAEQPVLPNLSKARKFKSYYGLSSAQKKFEKFIKEYDFVDIAEANKLIDWDKVPVIKI